MTIFKEHPELMLVAALIAGVFSLVSLILSKDMKVSEARLMWNHELRAELAKMLAGLKYITKVAESRREIKRENSTELSVRDIRDLREDLKDHYVETLRAFYHADMCLDPTYRHKDYKTLLDKIQDVETKFWGNCSDTDELNSCYQEILEAARLVLVKNWKDTKKGEPWFFVTRWALFGSLVAAIALGATYVSYTKPMVDPTPETEGHAVTAAASAIADPAPPPAVDSSEPAPAPEN
jgi:hypothetical protein